MRVFLVLGSVAYAAQDAGAQGQAEKTEAAFDHITNKADVASAADRIGSLTAPSTWTGSDTLDDADLKIVWADRDETQFNEDVTSDAVGAGWIEEEHGKRAYNAITVKNVFCDAVQLMEFEVALDDWHTNRNPGTLTDDNEVILTKFLCKDSGESDVDFESADGISGTVSLNPYHCNPSARVLTDSDLADATVTVKIEFRVVSRADASIEFHKYQVEASCEFNTIYNTNTGFGVEQKTTGIDTEVFQLLDTDFGIVMSQTSLGAADEDPVFRANENIEAVIYTNYDAVSKKKWEKLNILIGYAPIQCLVEQQQDDPAATLSSITIFSKEGQGAEGDRGGHSALELVMEASLNLRVWYFKYVAFIMAEDDNSGSYELQCLLQPCYYDKDTTTSVDNVCVKVLALRDVTHNGALLGTAGTETTYNKTNGADRATTGNDYTTVFSNSHTD